MLRASLRSRALAGGFATRSHPQWLTAQRSLQASIAQQRYYVDPKKPDEAGIAGVPTSTINQPNSSIPEPIVELGNMPKLPPKPEEVGSIAAQPSSSSPPPSEPAPVAAPFTPPKRNRLRRWLINLFVLGALGYGVGVYYALVSDQFHDIFTEYVPFAEDAVAYFEERAFKKRFPGSSSTQNRLHPQIRGESKVKVGSRSGVTAREAQDEKSTDLAGPGRHMSALEEPKPLPPPEQAKKEADATSHKLLPDQKKNAPAKPAEKLSEKPAAKTEATKDPAPQPKQITTEAPPPTPPIPAVDNISIELGTEPVVQDVVKILNDIITVVNADGAQGKYSSTIDTAKGNLSKVISDLKILKETEQKAAEDKITNLHTEFDNMARELIKRQEEAIQNQEMRWKEEFESEQAKAKDAYEGKLKSEIEEARKVYEQKLKNELLEQAIALRKDFTSQVRNQVEGEREGRLSKLGELSDSVQELQKLTGEWNSVVDANLKTQHLLVAVEAVRAKLENADRPRPFIEELAALKEVAADDAVVNAAIASINPSAYQRGIPTSAQLVDRFRRVASEVRKASLLPEHAGVASHVASLVLSKVMFKKSGLPVGDDVESVLTRTEVLLEEGNLDQAAREMNALTGWAKTLSRDWLGDVRRVLEVQQALDVIAAEARLQSLLVD